MATPKVETVQVKAAPSRDQHHEEAIGLRDRFDRIAGRITHAVGSPFALATAVLLIIAWAISGPLFGFSDAWQLAINTGTTIITFLMVFVIQSTQNRDSKAIHLKLDELLRAQKGARNEFVNVEQATEEELKAREEEFALIAEHIAVEVGHPDPKAIARQTARAAVEKARRQSARPTGQSR